MRRLCRPDAPACRAGPDFDGLIVFDESHKAKNLVPEAGSKPTKVGAKVMEIQTLLPGARIMYCSATGEAPHGASPVSTHAAPPAAPTACLASLWSSCPSLLQPAGSPWAGVAQARLAARGVGRGRRQLSLHRASGIGRLQQRAPS